MIRIDNLRKTYGDFRLEVSMEVPFGSIIGLVGPNGAGKSTIFKLLLGLIREDREKGDSGAANEHRESAIQLFGKAGPVTAEQKARMGVVLPDSGFSEELKGRDVCRLLAAAYPLFQRERFLDYCGRLQVPLDKQIRKLSSGMKAKLKLASALSHQADLLLLDEPTAGLDVVARDQLLNLLRRYMEEKETRSILVSSHISSDLEGLCDSLYLIGGGRMLIHEEVDVLLSDYGLLKVGREDFERLDRRYILRVKEEAYGWSCLTSQRGFYEKNYPAVTVEKGSIDDLILMMIRGKEEGQG